MRRRGFFPIDCRILFLFSTTHSFLFPKQPNQATPTALQDSPSIEDDASSLKQQYARARNVRTLSGHESACSLYQEILRANPDDRTAGTRIAASPLTNARHDQTCNAEASTAIIEARNSLLRSNYNHDSVARFFGQEGTNKQFSCQVPLFVSPVEPGSVSVSNYPLKKDSPPLAYLISLFLLSLAVPIKWLEQALGKESVRWMQELGWAFPCSNDPSLMVPYVHVSPLDFNPTQSGPITTTLWLVTDLHPRVLSVTSVGTTGTGNTVMYIGPDSLALAQHFDPYSQLSKVRSAVGILDLGTGSGIQALSAIQHFKMGSNEKQEVQAVAVDVNERALRFAKFNAMLNGMDDDLTVIHADLVSGRCLDSQNPSQLKERLEQFNFHLILGNPPFLPVPSDKRNDDDSESAKSAGGSILDSIDRRYGLFSSGGASGELLLKRNIEIASRHLKEGGYLGIVSEFFLQRQDPKFERFGSWWKNEIGSEADRALPNRCAKGVLFLNEYPIDADTYASRRADNPGEKDIWVRHLESLNIASASPGLLYIRKASNDFSINSSFDLAISPVPKTQTGSIWTPSNWNAITFTQATCNRLFEWSLPTS